MTAHVTGTLAVIAAAAILGVTCAQAIAAIRIAQKEAE